MEHHNIMQLYVQYCTSLFKKKVDEVSTEPTSPRNRSFCTTRPRKCCASARQETARKNKRPTMRVIAPYTAKAFCFQHSLQLEPRQVGLEVKAVHVKGFKSTIQKSFCTANGCKWYNDHPFGNVSALKRHEKAACSI